MLTGEQELVIKSDAQVVKVQAFAGTGKTHTLLKKIEDNPQDKYLYLVFNSSMKLSAEGRIRTKNATVKTCHGLAYASCGHKYKPAGFKNPSSYMVSKKLNVQYKIAFRALKTVEAWSNSKDEEISKDHVPAKSIFTATNDDEYTASVAKIIWKKMINQEDTLNFPMPHYGYLKEFQLSKPNLNTDYILLDEAQDTNPVVSDIVDSQIARGTKIIAVGDTYQSLYSWRGAKNYLYNLCGDTLYLTKSFRFGNEIGELASKFLEMYHSQKFNITGIEKPTKVGPFTEKNYTVITRSNAWLVYQAYKTTQIGKTIYVPGTEHGSLALFITLMDVYNLYIGNIKDIKNIELRNVANFSELRSFIEDGLVYDYEIIIACALVSKHTTEIPSIIDSIQSSLKGSPAEAEVILTTAHKAKGLEWENVRIDNDFSTLSEEVSSKPHPLPISYDLSRREDRVHYEEVNAAYVAMTRATSKLELNSELESLLA